MAELFNRDALTSSLLCHASDRGELLEMTLQSPSTTSTLFVSKFWQVFSRLFPQSEGGACWKAFSVGFVRRRFGLAAVCFVIGLTAMMSLSSTGPKISGKEIGMLCALEFDFSRLRLFRSTFLRSSSADLTLRGVARLAGGSWGIFFWHFSRRAFSTLVEDFSEDCREIKCAELRETSSDMVAVIGTCDLVAGGARGAEGLAAAFFC
jgi:hypothetical protein